MLPSNANICDFLANPESTFPCLECGGKRFQKIPRQHLLISRARLWGCSALSYPFLPWWFWQEEAYEHRWEVCSQWLAINSSTTASSWSRGPQGPPGGRMNNPLLYQLPGWKIPMIGYVHGNPGTSCSTTRRSLDQHPNSEMVHEYSWRESLWTEVLLLITGEQKLLLLQMLGDISVCIVYAYVSHIRIYTHVDSLWCLTTKIGDNRSVLPMEMEMSLASQLCYIITTLSFKV